MIQKIKLILATMALSFGLVAAVPAVAFAVQKNTITDGLCSGANQAASRTEGSCTTTGGNANESLKNVANDIVNIFSIIVGIVAIIMIIYGGFRYITSGGDSGRVGNAKNTLIYAIVGLIIVALAQFLVHFVFTTTTSAV